MQVSGCGGGKVGFFFWRGREAGVGTDRGAPGCCQGWFVSVGVSGPRQAAAAWAAETGQGMETRRWSSEEKRGCRGEAGRGGGSEGVLERGLPLPRAWGYGFGRRGKGCSPLCPGVFPLLLGSLDCLSGVCGGEEREGAGCVCAHITIQNGTCWLGAWGTGRAGAGQGALGMGAGKEG